jgi:hypothetical protein
LGVGHDLAGHKTRPYGVELWSLDARCIDVPVPTSHTY